MKLQILQENFSKALSTTSRFVSPHAQLPVLSNILLRAQGTRLYLMSTNLELSIATSIGAKIEKEGEITIPAKVLTELVSNLARGALDITSEQEQLNITSSGFKASVLGLNPSEFPSIPQDISKDSLELEAKTIIKTLGQVVFSASSDETRPILTGVLVTSKDSSLYLVGTDGFRLSQKRVVVKKDLNITKTIIPKAALVELARIAADEDKILIEIKDEDKQVLFGIGDSILSSRVIEGDFPPYEKIIPTASTTEVRLNREELLRATKLALVFARDGGYVGKVIVIEGQLQITAESSKSGSQQVQVEAKVSGPDLEILYNLHFIEEFLNSVAGEEIVIGLTNADAPGIFKDSSDPNLLHLIMPVKV